MEDISNLKLVERTFTLDKTLAENSMLKKSNKFLLTTTVLIGVLAIGLFMYAIDQEHQKK